MTAWGKLLSVTGTLAATLGADQPFRYRGYVYDTETGWYYLQSRYYDPTICRFISADVLLSTGQGVLGHNSFAYCLNNPVNRMDPAGCRSLFKRIVDFFANLLFGGGCQGPLASPVADDEEKEVVNPEDVLTSNPKSSPISGNGNNTQTGSSDSVSGDLDFNPSNALYHYTTEQSAQAIISSGIIRANPSGKVYLTTDQIALDDVNNALFMGQKAGFGKSRITDPQECTVEDDRIHPHIPRKQAGRVVFPGKGTSGF